MNDFHIPVGKLKARKDKKPAPTQEAKIDAVADDLGFGSREPQSTQSPKKKGRGRPKSPRTGQVHAKVMPPIHEEIADEATKRGVTQGVVLEEAWALYKKAQKNLT